MNRQNWIIGIVILGQIAAVLTLFGPARPSPDEPSSGPDHLRATYSELHFKPLAEAATDEQCLACHREVIEDRVRPTSPSGIKAAEAKAWYQTVSTYAGDQETFHRRHLVTPLARQLMNLRCNTCHQGHDPREEAPGSSANSAQNTNDIVLRKQVNPETNCLKCHGQMNWRIMGLTGPWAESGQDMGNDCFVCHATIRTARHEVNYLNAAAIEEAGQGNADLCHGCHGGRAWYRISYPYPRHPWPNMPPQTPDWARDRPTASEPRFTLVTSP